MFGNNKKNSKNQTSSAPPSSNGSAGGGLNSLVQGTVIEGNVTADSDIRIDGTINGTLNCKAKVIIGPTGRIKGKITCANAMIEGKIEGELIVSELLNVRKTAHIQGDVSTKKLIVEEGAIFEVSCNMMNQSGMNGIKGKIQSKQKAEAAV